MTMGSREKTETQWRINFVFLTLVIMSDSEKKHATKKGKQQGSQQNPVLSDLV